VLKKVISGGQTGADEAGLYVAQSFKIQTGGFAPKGWITKTGPNLMLRDVYGLTESMGGYKKRTWENVEHSDGTIRLAYSFNSPGEICTLNAINHFKKPCFDVDLNSQPEPIQCCEWIIMNDIKTLNIAGNTETSKRKVFSIAGSYLNAVFKILDFQNLIHRMGEKNESTRKIRTKQNSEKGAF